MIEKQSIKPMSANIKTKPEHNSIQGPGHQTLTADCSEVLKFPLSDTEALGEEPSSDSSRTGDGGPGGAT